MHPTNQLGVGSWNLRYPGVAVVDQPELLRSGGGSSVAQFAMAEGVVLLLGGGWSAKAKGMRSGSTHFMTTNKDMSPQRGIGESLPSSSLFSLVLMLPTFDVSLAGQTRRLPI